jgi:hypothetical protein
LKKLPTNNKPGDLVVRRFLTNQKHGYLYAMTFFARAETMLFGNGTVAKDLQTGHHVM